MRCDHHRLHHPHLYVTFNDDDEEEEDVYDGDDDDDQVYGFVCL